MTVEPPWYWSRIMPPIDRLDVERIAAEHPALDPLVQQRLDGLLLPFERRLADARQAGVGAQADEQIIPQPGVGQKRLEADDLQGTSRPESRITETVPLSATRAVHSSGLGDRAFDYRTAIGLPGEPVAPLSRSGAKMKANS